jgi:hypothetical protein
MRRMPDKPDTEPDECRAVGVVRLRLLAVVQFALVIATAFSFAFTPLRASHDEWWHLKAGRWIVENKRLPVNDIFTYTGENIRWHNHEWLSQVLFYGIYSWGEERMIGGLRALITFKAAIVAATLGVVGLLAWLRCGAWSIAFLVSVIAADVARRTIYPRPPILSYLLFAGMLLMLYSWKKGCLKGRWLWVLAPVTVLWANLHGMVLLGIATAGAFAAGELFEAVAAWLSRRRAPDTIPEAANTMPEALRRFGLLAGLTAAIILAATASPSGAHIFFLSRNFTADPILQRVISEMLPTPFVLAQTASGAWFFNPLYVSFWASLALLVVLFLWNRCRFRFGADYVLTAFFTFQAVMHVRLLPLYAIAVSGTIAFLLAERLKGMLKRRPDATREILIALTAALAGIYVFAVAEPPPQTFFRRNLALFAGKDKEPADYPEQMMKYIIRTRFPDRMFSQVNYCGYAIWWLSPEHHKLFTDNRFDVFGSRFFVEEATVVNGVEKSEARIGSGWNEILDRYGVNFVVISRDAPLNGKLRASGGWDHVYYDIPHGGGVESGFSIWLRRDPRFADIAERARANFRADNPGMPSPEELDARLFNVPPFSGIETSGR